MCFIVNNYVIHILKILIEKCSHVCLILETTKNNTLVVRQLSKQVTKTKLKEVFRKATLIDLPVRFKDGQHKG